VVLETSQRVDLRVADDVAGTHHTCDRVAANDTVANEATRDVAELGATEDLHDLGTASLTLFELGLEHALERRLDVLEHTVDHRVEAHVDALAVREFLHALGRANVEAQDDRVVDSGQVDVVLRDGTHTTVD